MSGLSTPRIVFGVHSLTPYSRVTGLPYGILKVIGSASLALTCAVDELFGGAQRFSWAAESKTISTELTAKVKAYPGFLFQQFLGGLDTDNAAETAGSASDATNMQGTSVVAATGIVATVSLTSGKNGDVKFGRFVVVAVGATTVDVYALSDVDFPRGADPLAYVNDALKITASPLTIVQSTGVDIPDTGLTLTGGASTIALTIGDTAVFTSRPINGGSSDITVGEASTALPAFGSVILAMKRNTAEMFEITAFNCIASGFPIPMTEMAFSETEMKVKCVYDAPNDAVFKIRAVAPTTFN